MKGDLKQLMKGFSELTMVCIELGVYGAIVKGSCKMSFLKRNFGVKKRHTHSFNLSTSLFFLVDALLHLLIIMLILFICVWTF
jgi:hypothetical protein